MGKDFSSLTNYITEKIVLWAKESLLRVLTVLFFVYIFFFPLAQSIQDLIFNLPYSSIIFLIISFIQTNFSLVDLSILLLALIILLLYLILKRRIESSVKVKEEFKSDLNEWSIPLNSSWVRQKCKEYLGNMLRVSNSRLPGTLKATYSWYDYEMSFWAKMDKSNINKGFGFAVRVEDSSNAVVFQIINNKFIPYLLLNGSFIRDEDNEEDLTLILDEEEWARVKVIVRGNIVELNINGNKIVYKIPSGSYNVESFFISGFNEVTLRQIKRKDGENKERWSQLLSENSRIEAMRDGVEKETARREFGNKLTALPATTKIILDYQKGAVGFRTEIEQTAYFRKLFVKKINII